MKLISEFTTNDLGCIVEENEQGKKRLLYTRSLHAI